MNSVFRRGRSLFAVIAIMAMVAVVLMPASASARPTLDQPYWTINDPQMLYGTTIKLSDDGRLLVAGTALAQDRIAVYSTATKSLLWAYNSSGGFGGTYQFALSADNSRLLAVDVSGMARMFLVSGSGSPAWTYNVGSTVTSVAISQNGDRSVIATQGKLILFNQDGFVKNYLISTTDYFVADMSKDASLIVGALAKDVYFFDRDLNLQDSIGFSTFSYQFTSVQVSDDGHIISAAAFGRNLALIHYSSGGYSINYLDLGNTNIYSDLSADGSTLFVSTSGRLFMLDVMEQRITWNATTYWTGTQAMNADGKLGAIVVNEVVRLYGKWSSAPVSEIRDGSFQCAISADGETIATIGQSVNIYKQTLKMERTLSANTVAPGERFSATVYVSNDAGPVVDANVQVIPVGGQSFGVTVTNVGEGFYRIDLVAPNANQISSVPLRIVTAANGMNAATQDSMITVDPALKEGDNGSGLSLLLGVGIVLLAALLLIVIVLQLRRTRKP